MNDATRSTPDGSKAWAVSIEGKQLKLYDFSVEELDKLGTKHGVSWLQVINGPAVKLALAIDVITEAAVKLAVDAPTVTTRNVLSFLDLVDDDLPTHYEEGAPLGGEKETTTSSRSSTSKAGPRR